MIFTDNSRNQVKYDKYRQIIYSVQTMSEAVRSGQVFISGILPYACASDSRKGISAAVGGTLHLMEKRCRNGIFHWLRTALRILPELGDKP